MKSEYLQSLFRYNYWANHHLFEVIEKLSDKEFKQEVSGGHSSIRNTLVHILSAEWGWISRSGGPERKEKLVPDFFDSPDQVISKWKSLETSFLEYVDSLTRQQLEEKVTYLNGSGDECSMPREELLQHIIIHNTHHRGQIALDLRVLGYTPGNFDILFYFAEVSGNKAW